MAEPVPMTAEDIQSAFAESDGPSRGGAAATGGGVGGGGGGTLEAPPDLEAVPTSDEAEDDYEEEEKEPSHDDWIEEGREVVKVLNTRNWILLLVGLMFGLFIGYIFYIFYKKALLLWGGAGVGALIAYIIESRWMGTKEVKIYARRADHDMLSVPEWENGQARGNDFYIQSNFYTLSKRKRYYRSTAIWHWPKTTSITIAERLTWSLEAPDELVMDSGLGKAASMLISAIFTLIKYVVYNDALDKSIVLIIVVFFVFGGAFVICFAILEIELRKRRFLQRMVSFDNIRTISLASIGQISRYQVGQHLFRELFAEEAQGMGTVGAAWLKVALGPLMLAYKFIVSMVIFSVVNGALFLWIFVTVALALMFHTHTEKVTNTIEPCMAFCWIAFIVNVYQVWYTVPLKMEFMNRFQFIADIHAKRIVCNERKRIPRRKLLKIWIGFLISLGLILLTCLLITVVKNDIIGAKRNLDFDKSWKENYKAQRKWINCKAKDRRRLVEEEEENRFEFATVDLDEFAEEREKMGPAFDKFMKKDKKVDQVDAERVAWEKDYGMTGIGEATRRRLRTCTGECEDLCKKKNYNAWTAALFFCTIDWFLVSLLALYWYMSDRYSVAVEYDGARLIWHQVSRMQLRTIRSKMTFLGRILGGDFESSASFWIHDNDAAVLHRWLVSHVPWHQEISPGSIGKQHVEPVDYAAFGRRG